MGGGNSGCNATNVSLGAAIATDDCAVTVVSNNAPALFLAGTNFVTWTAVDVDNQAVTCQQRVVVRDSQPPALTCPPDVFVFANTASCTPTEVNLSPPAPSDNSGAVTLTSTVPPHLI